MTNAPTAHEIEAAITRAIEHRRAIYETDPAYAGHTNLTERVSGVIDRPRAGDDDWWEIGAVIDAIAGEELVVWYRPRRLRLEPRYLPLPVPRPWDAERIYCNERGAWMDRETDEPVRCPDGSLYQGKERPDWLPEGG